MFDISKKMDDKLALNNKEYQLLLSFDRVLWIFDMWGKGHIPVELKPKLALAKLTDDVTFKDMDTRQALAIYADIFEKHIQVTRAIDEVDRYDIEGNVLPKKPKMPKITMINPYLISNMMASTFFHRLCRPITLI